jgi:hypothetical protein
MIEEWGKLIPDDLITGFKGEQVPIIFIGSGFGKEAIPPLATGGQLESQLRTDLNIDDTGEGLAELLQYLQNKSVGAKRVVVTWLKQHLLHGVSMPGGAHRMLLGLPCREFLTTNYDSLLIEASRRIPNYTLTPIDDPGTYESYKADARVRENEAILCRLHGAFESEDRLVATTDDYIKNYVANDRHWRDIVQTILRNRTLVFIGYSLRDFTTWSSYISIFSKWRGSMPPHVMVSPVSSSHITTFWGNYGIQYVPLKAFQFLIGLHDRLGSLETNEATAVAAAAACLEETCEDAAPRIEKFQRDFGYSQLLMAALRIVEGDR